MLVVVLYLYRSYLKKKITLYKKGLNCQKRQKVLYALKRKMKLFRDDTNELHQRNRGGKGVCKQTKSSLRNFICRISANKTK